MSDDREMLPPPGNPMAVARHILPAWQHENVLALRHWRGTWMRWEGPRWAEIDDRAIRAELYRRLEHAWYLHKKDTGEVEKRPWAPSKRKISDLMEATAAITYLSATIDAPSWINGTDMGPIVACPNGLLRVADRELIPHSPDYLNLVAVPFDYDPHAPEPKHWLEFLDQLWPTSPDDEHATANSAASIAALQEFFGYVISGRTDLHKILLIVGPTRSGKGTIARVLTALIGKGNIAGPTLASLGSNFGLSPLLGKPLAIVSDARMSGRDAHQIVERLLTISGEDTIDIDRKYRDPWTGRLPTRLMILSNELPKFGDSSGVIAHRFLVLTMTRSWLGKENTDLEDLLLAELPGILNWALDGLERLNQQRRFTVPPTSADAVITMQDTASPVSAFVRECCQLGPTHESTFDDLWAAWKDWCLDSERKPGTKQLFGRDLQSAAPQIHRTRPRADDDTEKRITTYTGIALTGTTNNAPGRVPSVPTPSSGSLGHAGTLGTRSRQLWAQHSPRPEDAVAPNSHPPPHDGQHPTPVSAPPPTAWCAACGEPMTVLDPDQTTHPTCTQEEIA